MHDFLVILVPRMLVLFIAKWQVSWLLPAGASSQEVVPVTFVRQTQKAITVAGTAPVFHRIPSLPDLLSPPKGSDGLGITICAANLQLFMQ